MRHLIISISLLLASSAAAQNAITVTSLEGYGSFETAGATITFSGDANSNAQFSLTVTGPDGVVRPVHPPARFDSTHAATSVFGLQPDTNYTVALTTADPDGVSGGTQATTIHTRAEISLPAALRDVYVATSGNNSGAGDSSHPFATIQHAIDQSQPGDVIHISAGIYREELSVSASGTASHPIALLGDPGAILDGADPTLESGTASWSGSGPVFSTPFSADARYAAIDGTRLWHQEDASACPLTGAAAHTPGDWCISGGTLYVALASGSPNGHAFQVSALNTGIDVESANDIWLQGLEIRFYGTGDYAKGIYLHTASDCVVASNSIHNNTVNLWLKYGDHNVMQDNDSFDTGVSGFPWIDAKAHDEESAGISITDAVGIGNVIRRNHVHGTFDGIDFCGLSAANTTTENDVYDNLIDDHLDDGSEADGNCVNARMFRNRFVQTHMGISLAPASPGPLFILRNVIYRYGARDPGDVSTPFKFNNGYDPVTTNVFAYHNTAISDDAVAGVNVNDQPAIWLGEPGHAQGVVLRNNLLVGSAYALEASDDTDVHLDLDSDDLFTTDPTRYVRWWDGSAVQHYLDLPSFSAATGEEVHGYAQQPTFVDLAGGDLTPAAGSVAIDHGEVIPGIDDDYSGNAPDLGAIELGVDGGIPSAGAVTSGSSGTTSSASTTSATSTSGASATTTSGTSSTTSGTSGTSTTGHAASTSSSGGSAGSHSGTSASATAGSSGSSGSGTSSSGCGCNASSPVDVFAGLALAAIALGRRRANREEGE